MSGIERPLVTVIAVCFNHSRYLVDCLESIRLQTFADFELLVFDDCSLDDSANKIRTWITRNNFPCNFVAHEHNLGLCRTLNEALSLAAGKYVSIVATDDVWLPNKLAVQVRLLESSPENVAVVFSDAFTMSSSGTLKDGAISDYYRGLWGSIPQGNVYNQLLVGCFVPAPTAMIKRAAFDLVGMYDESLDYEDWDMWLRLARHFEFAFVNEKLAKYRIVETSMQSTLLNRTTIPKHRTQFKIFAKHVRNPSLSPANRRRIRLGLVRDAETLYELAYPHASSFLYEATKLAPGIRAIILFLFASLRLPYASFKRIENRKRKYSSYVRWKLAQLGFRR